MHRFFVSLINVSFMRLLLICLTMFFSLPLEAEYIWTTKCLSAYDYALRLNFKRSSQILEEEKKRNPNNLIPIYIESQNDFLKSFIYEDIADLKSLKRKNEIRINQFEKDNIKSPYKLQCIAEMYLQIALARVKFEEYIGCAYDIRKAYKILEKNIQLYPEFAPNLKGIGLIHSLVGAIPKNYSWTANLLGMNGTIKQGIGELNNLLNSTYSEPELHYLRDETILMITFLEMNLSKNRNDEKIRIRLNDIKDINDKPLLQFTKSVFFSSNGENDSIINILSSRNTNLEASSLPYLDYMEGSSLLNNLNYTSINCFQKFQKNFKGNSYSKSVWQRIAWIKLLQGDTLGYLQNMNKCNEQRNIDAFTDEDKQAVIDSRSNVIPNVILLRSRLLFDGGYYDRSLKELINKTISYFPTNKDQLEFTYRLGRIYDKQNKKEKALQLYEQTLKNGSSLPYYFAANSALLIGKIYEDQEDKNKAIEYYQKALSLREHDYQNSIDQKAKSGLNRLGL